MSQLRPREGGMLVTIIIVLAVIGLLAILGMLRSRA
jgi:hypothetical protein